MTPECEAVFERLRELLRDGRYRQDFADRQRPPVTLRELTIPISESEARALLALAESAPTWTAEVPTEAGWHWWRREDIADRPVRVMEWPDGGLVFRVEGVRDTHNGYLIPNTAGGEWCVCRPPADAKGG